MGVKMMWVAPSSLPLPFRRSKKVREAEYHGIILA